MNGLVGIIGCYATLSPSAIVILRERKRPKNLRCFRINSVKCLFRYCYEILRYAQNDTNGVEI